MKALRCYYKDGCHLCDELFIAVQPLVDTGKISLERIEISDAPTLLASWGEYIPVLTDLHDEIICRYFFDADIVRKHLAD